MLPVQQASRAMKSAWKDRVVKLSGIFDAYPRVLSSGVEMQISQSTNYLVNSEGTVLRTPEDLAYIRVVARGLAPDGTQVRDAAGVSSLRRGRAARRKRSCARQVTEVAEHVTALSQAPAGEAYDGPVLFEAAAAAQLFGQLLGDNLKITRKPVADAGPHRALCRRANWKIASGRAFCRSGWMWWTIPRRPNGAATRCWGIIFTTWKASRPQPLTLVEKGRAEDFPADAHAGVQGIRQLQRTRAHDRIVRRRRARVRQSVHSRLPDPSRCRT